MVTSRNGEPTELYDRYVGRDERENRIEDFGYAWKADGLSCHSFFANQLRLLLHTAVYWLLDALRRKPVTAGAKRLQLDTLRL